MSRNKGVIQFIWKKKKQGRASLKKKKCYITIGE